MPGPTLPIRNVILLGHSHSGKTQLAEALMASAGAISKQGTVNEGTTISDFNDDEKERKVSINTSVMHFDSDGKKVNLVDVPGYNDFSGEALSGLIAADIALIVVNGPHGVEMGTTRAFKRAERAGLRPLVFINMLEKENADFSKCVEMLTEKLGKKCAVLTYPIGQEAALSGVADLVAKTKVDELGEAAPEAAKLAESLVENVAESDDVLIEKYLESGELGQDEVSAALKKAIIDGKIVPILAGSAMKMVGIKELINCIVTMMPSPAEMPPVEATDVKSGEKIELGPESDVFCAQVFKTISDPYVGQITIFRVISGMLSSNHSFYNATKKEAEKAGQILTLMGKEQKHLEAAKAGDIAAVAKLKNTNTGDTLSSDKKPVLLPERSFPEPAISFSIKPKTRSDEDKISGAIHKLTNEDVAFRAVRDPQTKELVVSGMGELHIKIMMKRLKSRFGVDVEMGTPKVAYRETITGTAGAQYRHKKQSGGAGQFAEVWLRVEPLERGQGFEFVSEVTGGSIPGPFIVSCEKGIKTALQEGALAGFPLVDVKATVYDGKTHPVDSKDIAFQVAARNGFKEAVMKSKPVLLEPIMKVEVTIPDDNMGDITGSLNSHRGRIMGMDPGGGVQIVTAKVPLEEMYKWSNELKSLTGGRGTYTMKFSHYAVVPGNIVQTIVDKAKQTQTVAAE